MNTGNILHFINLETAEGKKYVSEVENMFTELRKEKGLNITKNNEEKVRFFRSFVSQEKEKKYMDVVRSFLRDDDLKQYELVGVTVGQYGRKSGTSLNTPSSATLRLVIHLGPTEVYYLTTESYKDRPLILQSGQGVALSTVMGQTSELKVYPDPIRVLNNKNLQAQIPKIRPKPYMRYTLVLDFKMLPEEVSSDVSVSQDVSPSDVSQDQQSQGQEEKEQVTPHPDTPRE